MSKKKVLGRGLGALIKDSSLAGLTSSSTERAFNKNFFMCKVVDIMPNSLQPRLTFDEAKLAELTASIKQKGIIEPLVVNKREQGYELIAGERRLRAGRLAGLKEVPVVVLEVSPEESLELAIIENIQREDLNAIDEAKAYKRLKGFGLSQEEIAQKVGKQRASVANYLRLLKLPVEVKDEICAGRVSMGHAKALLALDSNATQRDILAKIISKGLSVRVTEALVKSALCGARGSSAHKKKKEDRFAPVQDDLRARFATRVLIKEKGGRGKIEFEYFSTEERERLLEIFTSLV